MPPADRYQIVKKLGAGGMGIVYLANDTLLRRQVALKTIKQPEGGDEQEWRDAVQRLVREAQAAASLKHHHIVDIYDVIPDGSAPSIIMEYIRGSTLAEAARLGVPAELSFVLRALKECASALDYAHSRGRVHRDFKPENVMLDEAGGALIMDFGIAKLLDSQTDLTHGNVIGTCQYMSPEQMNAEPVDGRSDQYSLAVVAYQLLTGCRVFDAKTLGTLCTMVLYHDPPLATERSPGLPKAVDAVFLKGLAKKPADRYVSCAEFVKELEARLLPVGAALPKPSQDSVTTVTMVKTGRKAGAIQVNEMDGQRYVWIPPGTFQMGCSPGDALCSDDEKPAHMVTITRGFWMGETPVTVGAYRRYAQARGRSMPAIADDRLPVVYVTWDEAASYGKWAGGRLPTEAEWEYAVRAGATGARYGILDDIAWHSGNSSGSIKPVGLKQPNAFGLFDALGNVWEWTADWFSEIYYRTSERQDPPGPPYGTMRVLRGGARDVDYQFGRVSYRIKNVPSIGHQLVGFRCVVDEDSA